MTFTLPSAQYLMTSNASTNRGVNGSPATGSKVAGNLPITSNAAQLQNNTGSSLTGTPDRIYFGLDGQNTTTGYDVSTNTRVLVCSVQYNAPNRIQSSTLANEGASATVVSGTTEANFRRWFIGGNDTPFCSSQAGPVTICIDPTASGRDAEGGTFDETDFSGWGFGCVRFNLSGTSTLLCFFQRVFLFETTKGSTGIPKFTGASADWDDAFTAVQGSDYTNKIGAWLTKSGNSFFVPCPFQFGDGSTATTFDDGGAIVTSPANNAAGQENFRLSDQAMRVYLNQRDNAADSVTLSGSYSWGTAAPWDFDEDNLASCNITGAVFSGMGDFTLGGSVTGAATFTLASGSNVIINGANLDGSTINGDCTLNTETDLNNITINGNLSVNIGSNASLSFTNVTVTGDVLNDSSNTLTISASGSSMTTSEPGTGGGQVNIVQTVTTTIVAKDAETLLGIQDARVYVTAASGGPLASGTVLANDVTDSSGEVSFDINFSSSQPISGRVRKGTASPFYKTGVIAGTISGINSSIEVFMARDE